MNVMDGGMGMDPYFRMMCEEDAQPRTLYVGNLDRRVTEELVFQLFLQIAPSKTKSCKMIADHGNSDPYCFVEFYDSVTAEAAMVAMNGRTVFDKPIKVNWATTQGSRKDTTHHHHVFVGDLVQEMKTAELRALFDKYGSITDARVVRDPETGKSRCYGFVSFEQEEDAQCAIKEMNGAILPQYPGMKAIRTGWATRKPTSHKPPQIEAKDYERVLNETSPNNCTVYVGGLQFKFSEDLLRKVFGPFGAIQEVRTFPEKAFAFVRFANHESATNAIVSVHGSPIEGHVVKCSWGKESNESSGFQQPQAPSQQLQVQQGVGQFYQQQTPQQQQQGGFNQFSQYGYQQYPVGGGGQQYVVGGVPQSQQYGYYQNPGVVMQGGYVGGYNGGGGGGGGGTQGGYVMQQQGGGGGASAAVYPNSTQAGYIQPGYQ
ncbi:nucleolysin TIAR isoform X2 [Strongylocentrotus purpuratus]|uniref:RRM domain-containing protein n=1 Tax=Strongylocentrotus purpuratus TaxID=7668 RepID=A0A7M7HFR4_STRPU|nr:nucleolysin TIAR isoform X2 [Strongylocentrotus purpuratus]|eukprot:XP_011662750.1 PREDICTED: nucleolysin TIAR isoform X2 [Strongylocentrotus purpuratus]